MRVVGRPEEYAALQAPEISGRHCVAITLRVMNPRKRKSFGAFWTRHTDRDGRDATARVQLGKRPLAVCGFSRTVPTTL